MVLGFGFGMFLFWIYWDRELEEQVGFNNFGELELGEVIILVFGF